MAGQENLGFEDPKGGAQILQQGFKARHQAAACALGPTARSCGPGTGKTRPEGSKFFSAQCHPLLQFLFGASGTVFFPSTLWPSGLQIFNRNMAC